MQTVLFATNLGSRRILFPISAWRDSSFISKVVFRIHDSAPYSKVGNTQHSMMLLDESGLRVPWKVPLPLEKKAPLALLMLTVIHLELERLGVNQAPKHLAEWDIGILIASA